MNERGKAATDEDRDRQPSGDGTPGSAPLRQRLPSPCRAVPGLRTTKELTFQNEEKAKRAAELVIANKELTFQNEEKAKRAAELVIANKELAFQNEEKAKRAAELVIANKELTFQNEEKAKRAAELVIEITERKRAEEVLRKASEELSRTNDELTRFNYLVAHDLRTPIVTIKAFLGYLEKDVATQDAERMGKDLGYIHTAADKMSRLLDELLSLSRVGRKMNPPEEVPLQVVVKEALEMVAGQIAERGVQVQVTGEPVLLCGDRPRLVDIYQNLLDNACKFMGEQAAPRVEIGAEFAGDETVLFVRDNGIGIDPRYHPKIFGLFEKLDPRMEGTGLGLALVRRMVEVHGGKIWVESAGRGMGTTFRFTLARTKRLSA